MHAARLERSDRLRRVHELLSDGQPRSTFEIVQDAGVCAVNSIIAELRDGGAVIECRQATAWSGKRIWLYRMVQPVPSTTDGVAQSEEHRGVPNNPEVAGSTPAPIPPDPDSTRSWNEDEIPCEDCGCTDTLACEDELLGPCWWAERDDGRRVCSECDKKERARTEPPPPPHEFRQLGLFG